MRLGFERIKKTALALMRMAAAKGVDIRTDSICCDVLIGQLGDARPFVAMNTECVGPDQNATNQ